MRLRYWVSLVGLLLTLLSACTSVSNREAAEAYYNLGRAYFELGRLDDSQRAYKRAVELDPKLSVANYNLARLYIEEGSYDEAETILNELLTQDPDNTILHETLGWLAYRRGDPEAALASYKISLDLGVGNPAVWYNIGLIEREQGGESKALEAFAQAVYYAPDSILYRRALAGEYARLDDLQAAIDQLYPLYAAGRRDPKLINDLTGYLIDFEEYAAAYEVVEEVRAASSDDTLAEDERFERGRLYYYGAFALLVGFERVDEGLEYLEQALDFGFIEQEELAKLLEYPAIPGADEIKRILRDRGIERTSVPPPEESDGDNGGNEPSY